MTWWHFFTSLSSTLSPHLNLASFSLIQQFCYVNDTVENLKHYVVDILYECELWKKDEGKSFHSSRKEWMFIRAIMWSRLCDFFHSFSMESGKVGVERKPKCHSEFFLKLFELFIIVFVVLCVDELTRWKAKASKYFSTKTMRACFHMKLEFQFHYSTFSMWNHWGTPRTWTNNKIQSRLIQKTTQKWKIGISTRCTKTSKIKFYEFCLPKVHFNL